MKQNETNLGPKSSKFYDCKLCHYNTSKFSQYQRHVGTDKHKNRQNETNETKKVPKSSTISSCPCGKIYNIVPLTDIEKKYSKVVNMTRIKNKLAIQSMRVSIRLRMSPSMTMCMRMRMRMHMIMTMRRRMRMRMKMQNSMRIRMLMGMSRRRKNKQNQK
jgi:hypothetical protein